MSVEEVVVHLSLSDKMISLEQNGIPKITQLEVK